ncbi:MAG: hypothetical protein H6725_12650 [Sandaracinaceae bacterium]|nr:hypothetical protein [Sandaracinaceae bacterium]
MRPIEELCNEVDHALTSVGMSMTNGGFVKRTHTGTLDGMRLEATLSVFMDTGAPTRLTTGNATGYVLSIECHNGVATRWVMGKEIPVLLGAGLTRVANITERAMLRADDTDWAARFLAPSVKQAFTLLAEHGTFTEQRPGVLQLQVRRLGSTELPPLPALLQAFAALSATSLQPPAPRHAKARLADNRGLVVTLIAVAVIASVSVCGGFLAWLAS